MTNLTHMQEKALTTAINLLKGIGATYHIELHSFSVNTFSSTTSAKKKERKYAYGSVSRHIETFIKTLQPGEMVTVPRGSFDIATLQGTLTAWASREWGNNSYISTKAPDNTGVEILRCS